MQLTAVLRFIESAFAGAVLLFVLAPVSMVLAQDDDTSKAIRAEEFIVRRPGKNRRPSTVKYRVAAKSTEVVAAVPPAGMVFGEVGVTIWRFRPSTAADVTKELLEEDGETTSVTLERIKEGTPVAAGQRIRLSIESLSREGYLYVIDREQYSDGTFGEPLLIFPTSRTNSASYVKAGHLVYIPSVKGRFNIKPSKSGKQQVAEALTIIVSPQPLIAGDKLATTAIRLTAGQVESWEKEFGTKSTTYEMEGGAGRAMTEKEQAAGVKAIEFTQDDPPPQTVHRVTTKPDAPVLIKVSLPFGSS